MADVSATDSGSTTYEALLRIRRSVRRYQERPVPLGVIRDMIAESTLAPSAGNGQPWRYVIVNDRSTIERISDESKKNILARIASNPQDYASRYERMLSNASFDVFYGAPALVMIVGSTGLKNLHVDCALAASYLMMAAASRGLGTCWVNLGADIQDPDLRQELGLTDELDIVAPICVGYPEAIPTAPKRRPPEILRVIERTD